MEKLKKVQIFCILLKLSCNAFSKVDLKVCLLVDDSLFKKVLIDLSCGLIHCILYLTWRKLIKDNFNTLFLPHTFQIADKLPSLIDFQDDLLHSLRFFEHLTCKLLCFSLSLKHFDEHSRVILAVKDKRKLHDYFFIGWLDNQIKTFVILILDLE